MISFNSCVANGQCKKSLLTPSGEVDFDNFEKAKMAICTDENKECCDSRIIIKESISSECNIENGYDCRHAHDCDFNEPILKNSTVVDFLFKTDTESDTIYLDNEFSLCLKETQVCCKKSQSRLPEINADFFEIKSGTILCPNDELS